MTTEAQARSMTKDELVAIVSRKKNNSKPMPAIIPINKKGEIRAGTLGIEGGIGLAVFESTEAGRAIDPIKRGEYNEGARRALSALNPFKYMAGKVFWGGLATIIFGKGRKVGPGRLS